MFRRTKHRHNVLSVNKLLLDMVEYCKAKLTFKRTIYYDIDYEICRYVTPTLTYFDILIYKNNWYVIRELGPVTVSPRIKNNVFNIGNKLYKGILLSSLKIPFDYREWSFKFIDHLLDQSVTSLVDNSISINEWLLIVNKDIFIKTVEKPQLGISNRYAIENADGSNYFIVLGKTKKYVVISGYDGRVFMVDHPIKRYVIGGDTIYVNAINQPSIRHDNASPEQTPYINRGKLIGNKLITFNVTPVILNSKQYVYVLGVTNSNIVLVGKGGFIETLCRDKAPELKAGYMIEMNQESVVTNILINSTDVGNVYEKF